MNIEIERKFLVLSSEFKDLAYTSSHLVQGYLSTDKNRTVRVRIKDDQGYLTIKGKSSDNGLSRFEWEKEISKREALNLLTLALPGVIEKTRYFISFRNHIWEIDEFLGENKGLILAEVELESESEEFIKPDFIGEEVTGNQKYYNSYISQYPYSTW